MMRRLFAILAMAALCAVTPGCDKGTGGGDDGGGEEPTPDRVTSIRIMEILAHVDADSPEAIAADLSTETLWVEGGGYDLANVGSQLPNGDYLYDCIFVDADGSDMADATITVKDENADFVPAYSFLPIDNQILSSRKWILSDDDGGEWEYDMFVVREKFTRMSMPPVNHVRLYEDLTDYYQNLFPDAGVRSVARVMISY